MEIRILLSFPADFQRHSIQTAGNKNARDTGHSKTFVAG